MSLKPWREVIVPHPDVLNGTFQQSEFAADLTAVRTGRATPEYGDAKSFYERTFITEGMGKLLTQVGYPLKAGQFKSFTLRLVRSKERQYDSNGLTDEVTG
jgi:hypothetical protein